MRLLNHLMGNFRWFATVLRGIRLPPGSRVVELAAGDGSLGRYLFGRIPGAAGWACTGLDLCRRPARWPQPWDWERADLRESETIATAEVLIANHILHQFPDDALHQLGTKLPESVRLLLINEPVRRRLHLWQARAAFLLGLNHVSRHDALVSIRAGFLGGELPILLGLSRDAWTWQIAQTPLGACRMLARRRKLAE